MAAGRAAGRRLLLLLLIPRVGCWPFASVFGGGPPSSSTEHATDELDDSTFDGFLKENAITAVLFYAPWCFFSQQMMPSWDLAAQKLLLHDPPVKLAKIDAHRYGAVGEKFGVNSYPTMKLFADNAVFDYDSHQGRGWQQIVRWVDNHIDRDHVLKSVEEVDHYLHDNDLNVVGLFPDGYNSSTFVRSARHFEDVIFAEARGTKEAGEIAEHLARHASLVCETIPVGKSQGVEKRVELPRGGMHCSDQPRNPQRSEWTDRFTIAVEGTNAVVRRLDQPGGWLQNLQFKCCDADQEGGAQVATPKEGADQAGATQAAKPRYTVPVPSIVMFMPHDERFAIYDGDIADAQALDRWISARRSPMVMQLTMETADKILDSGPQHLPSLFFISRDPHEAMEKELREAAKKLRGRALMCFSGMSTQLEQRLADIAGIEEDSEPVVTLLEGYSAPGRGPGGGFRKFRLPTKDLVAAGVVKFIEDYEGGKLKPWLKSEPEPLPEDVALQTVGVLVGTTFTRVTQDEGADVLVDFYAPWCGHCRKFEPEFKALARKLQHVKSLKLLKFDATRNEAEGLQVMGFPTIMLFPAGKSPKTPVIYQGSRTVSDMVGWLQRHATKKFSETPPAAAATAAPEPAGLLDGNEEDL